MVGMSHEFSWPACAGLWEFFDSPELVDHLLVRSTCYSCDHFSDCADKALAEKKRNKALPTGTYAGVLWIEGTPYDNLDWTDWQSAIG